MTRSARDATTGHGDRDGHPRLPRLSHDLHRLDLFVPDPKLLDLVPCCTPEPPVAAVAVGCSPSLRLQHSKGKPPP
jgi:hypothetical protein